MSDDAKNTWDVMLTILSLIGALIAYRHTIRTWKESQRISRSEQLDKLINQFESNDLIRLACQAIDWTSRKTSFRQNEFIFFNRDVLISLKLHGDSPDEWPTFTPQQAILRDAFDEILSFFSRLQTALRSGLIEAKPAKSYFVYWLTRLTSMDRRGLEPDFEDPRLLIKKYIEMYADKESIASLCNMFSVKSPGI